MSEVADDVVAFEDNGFLGPIRVFTPDECRAIAARLVERPPPDPPDWSKGNAASSRFFYDLGKHPNVMAVVRPLLGPDILLWGAAVVRRAAGRVHPWHTDIETSGSVGRKVSVWIGLECTTSLSSLHLVPHSHQFGQTIQEVAQQHGKARGEVSDEDIAGWARDVDPRSGLVVPDMGNGDAVLFDGRLWHGSRNLNPDGVRVALLLQYATPDTPIRIPDRDVVEWPFQFLEEPLPPCILLSGSDVHGLNRLVAPPVAEGQEAASQSWIKTFSLPLPEDPETGWRRVRAFRGATAAAEEFNCHASVLSPGSAPHAPHSHAEEELLVPLAGELDVVLGGGDSPSGESVRTVGPGSFVYYAADSTHTVRNTSNAPATYVMFKWSGPGRGTTRALATSFFDAPFEPHGSGDEVGRRSHRVFRAETGVLEGLHCHTTVMPPGDGYPAHVDLYDVAIVLLEGEIETLGKRVAPHSVVFYAAGEEHGIRNPGTVPARYLVFEFHPAGWMIQQRGPAKPRRRRNVVLRLLRRAPIIWRLVPSGKRT